MYRQIVNKRNSYQIMQDIKNRLQADKAKRGFKSVYATQRETEWKPQAIHRFYNDIASRYYNK